jgi:NAD+ kinase
VGFFGILARVPAGSPLAQEIPALVELYRDALEASAVVPQCLITLGVGLLASEQLVLLADELFDASEDRFIGHGLRVRRSRPGIHHNALGVSRIGLVVHPTRDVNGPIRALRDWTASRGVELVQVSVPGQEQTVAEHRGADACELIVSIGGDGTALAATRAAAQAGRPVLGVACGSLGVLAAVGAADIVNAVERFTQGDWLPCQLPALHIGRDGGPALFALNDLVLVRAGDGQVRVTARIDGTLFARFAGDGCIVSTPVGSSASAPAAGGPLLSPDAGGYLCTPLSPHGGSCPPLVIAAGAELELDAVAGYDGARLEVDGHVADRKVGSLRIALRTGAATLVTFSDQEPFLTGLRRRRVIIDSPRILAEDDRAGQGESCAAPGSP